MAIVADTHPLVVGVDTDSRKRVYSILVAKTGAVIGCKDVPFDAAGMNRALARVARRTEAVADTLRVD